MSVEITAAQDAAIRAHGEAGWPNEICGVLLGREAGGHKTVTDLLPIENQFEADEQYHRFLITPQDMFRAEKQARGQGLSVVGFYHSHPEAEAHYIRFMSMHAALIGLGYATREADEAVSAVAPQAEAAEGTPQVGPLLRAALQTLNRAR